MSRLELLDGPSGPAEQRPVNQPRLVLGRGSDADWVFTDQTVSRRHAAVYHLADHDEIEDLESTAGTLVNGQPVYGRYTLRGGDVVQLASVRLRYVGDHLNSPVATREPATGEGTSFGIEDQRADVISNVGRDQFNHYVQKIIVSRDDAFRQIETMSRTARALTLAGFSVAAAGVLTFMGTGLFEMATEDPGLGDPEAFREAMQPAEFMGVPLFALAMGVALLGFAFLFAGVITHAAATTRTKNVDRKYPLPPGWSGRRPEDDR